MSEFGESMEVNPDGAGAPGLKISDIYYALFRHKWKILVLSGLACIAALGMLKFMPASFESEAKLLIIYVMETKSPTARGAGPDSQIISPDVRGENTIYTEMEILRSYDLAREVATNIGTRKIVGPGPGSDDPDVAADLILKSLMVEAPGKGKVIRMVFHHKDRTLVQPVMRQLIQTYEARHVKIHQSAGILDKAFMDYLKQLQEKLDETETNLANVRTDAKIVSVDETKKGYTEEISKIRLELVSLEAELAERKEIIEQARKALPKSDSAATELGAPNEIVSKYRRACQQLDYLAKQETSFIDKGYADENPKLKDTRFQIAEIEKVKQEMVAGYPKLATLLVSPTGTNGQRIDIAAELSRVTALQARMAVLVLEQAKINGDVKKLNEAEYQIKRLEREREAQEAMYKQYRDSVERARLADSGEGKVTNISEIQSPSPPAKTTSTLLKKLAMVLAAGFGGSIGLAFLIEMFIDQSIRRPRDIKEKIGMPLFVSIPDIDTNGSSKGHALEVAPTGENGSSPELQGMKPYCDALRDRLLTHFEVKNLTRKPKLVAVTSCSNGAGVTTVATGLAASLSETGDGNVLLVDMNPERGVVHPFHRGKAGCALPDVFDSGKRDAALVQENLYVVSARDVNDKLRALPKKLTDLFPKFKASDYDYIIFDMPAMNQLSMTPRLARFMDMVVLVVESEKTKRDSVKDANAYLLDSHASMVAVLNKFEPYVPKWLHEEN